MTFSSCLTEEDSALVLDSSVVINLLATGRVPHILQALSMPIVVTDNVIREIEQGAVDGRPEVDPLKQMIGDQTVRVVELGGPALQMFFDLVSGNAAGSLSDGEAATLAFAHANDCSAAIDEKKATKLSADRFTALRLATTVDILAHDAVGSALGQAALAEAVFRALHFARMQVREHQFEWVHALIGSEKAATCTSLRRLSNSAAKRSRQLVSR
jgi:predicted nucleic acid-binding protein